jgi:predicted transcriptional regulator
MKSSKTKEIYIYESKGTFFLSKNSFSKKDYDFESLSKLRALLSNEKARLIHVIKLKNPKSIYELAKYLKRGFKSVNDDIKLLEKFGFIELIHEKTNKRIRYKPVVVIDKINININI